MRATKNNSFFLGLLLLSPYGLQAQIGDGSMPVTYSISQLILGLLAAGFGVFFLMEWKKNHRIKQQLNSITAENHLLKQTKRELLHSNEVAMHDLKSPLRTISSFVNLFLRKYGQGLPSEGKEYLSFVQNAGQQLHQLIDEVKQSALPDSSNTEEWTDAGQVLQETLIQLNYDIQERQAKISITGDPLPKLSVRQGQLSRLFQNLIANGLKFTPSGTSPIIEINYSTTANGHTFAITDHGIGIADKDQSVIFERHTRLATATNVEGSGLGLASCQQIIEQVNGKIWLKSQPGKGSTFFFEIPNEK